MKRKAQEIKGLLGFYQDEMVLLQKESELGRV